jgi:hypothetical protein
MAECLPLIFHVADLSRPESCSRRDYAVARGK